MGVHARGKQAGDRQAEDCGTSDLGITSKNLALGNI